MSETYDVLSSSIAVPVEGDNHAVNGNFAQVGDEYEGMAGKRRVWTEDALRSAAEELVGAPITKPIDSFEPHPGVRKTEDGRLEVAPTPPPESIIGNVTEARYDDAMGLLWQGELTDETMNTQVENGHVEVSPVVSLDTEETDDGSEEIRDTKSIRDLTIVSSGALPGNSIEPGTAEAMTADALAAAFDDEQNSDELAESSVGSDEDENPIMEDITDSETELIAASRQMDDPKVIESEDADRLAEADALMAQAEDKDEPKVVDESEYDALQDNVETVRGVLEDALCERTDLKESTISALSFDALASEFEDEDGEFDADALVQNPETGSTDEPVDEEPEVDEDALSKARALQNDIETLGDSAPDALYEDVADLVDADDYDAAMEVL